METTLPQPREMTVSEIAAALRVPRPRVCYACEAYGIHPVRRAGMVWLFSTDDLPRIRSAVARVANRGGQL